jgi:hypothetical protein
MRRLQLWHIVVLLVVLSCVPACVPRAPAVSGQSPAPARTTTPTVGDTVSLAVGRVTLVSVTTTAPPHFGSGVNEPSLWLNFTFVNSTTASATIGGFRGPPFPAVRAADDSTVGVNSSSTRLENGGGGWGIQAKGVGAYLNPGGVMYASFGLRPKASQYAPGRLPLTVQWRPLDGGPEFSFEVH